MGHENPLYDVPAVGSQGTSESETFKFRTSYVCYSEIVS